MQRPFAITLDVGSSLANRFELNYDYCKACGICVSECPCGAIEMVPESL